MRRRARVAMVGSVLAAVTVALPLYLMPTATSAAPGQLHVMTGEMLGDGYNKRWFYVSVDGGAWQPTYSGSAYKTAARGKLMNFRASQVLFDDENRTDDDPDANTSRFIEWIDDYAAHDVLAYTIGLQSGNPGYEGGIISAFRSDGTLKQPWLDRASRVIEAANANGQIVILSYFYQRQDERLASNTAVRTGVRNATDWLISKNYRNVIIEIANEYDSTLYKHTVIKTNSATGGIAELVNIAKSRFDGLGWRLPVSVSSRSSSTSGSTGAVRDAVDLVLVHGSVNTAPEDGANVAALVADPAQHGPIVMNEDRQDARTSDATLSGLNAEKATATNVFNAGGSWGMSWQSYMQIFPFAYAIGEGTNISGNNKANYFHAVLDHMRSLTSTTPHPTSSPSPTPSPTVSVSPTASISPTPTVTPTPSVTPTPTVSPSVTPTPTTSPPPGGQAVTSFTLVNTGTDLPVPGFDPVPAGAVIDMSDIGTRNLTVRANVSPAVVGSVRWGLDSVSSYRTENTAPYALAGDKSGDFAPWTIAVGSHTVTATPFTAANATGTTGTAASVTFTLAE